MPKSPTKTRKKSNCWQFFTKSGKGGRCRLCPKEIVSNGNTTNLLNHLKRKHPIQWESAAELNEEKYKIEHKQYKSRERGDRSEEDEEGEQESAAELHRSPQQSHGLAYQTADGRTVIWLHPDVQMDQLSASGFDQQITLVEQSSNSAEETTALSQKVDGDIVAIAGEEITVQSSKSAEKPDETVSDLSESLVVDSGAQKNDVVVSGSGDVCQVVNCTTLGEEFTAKSSINSNPQVSYVNCSPPTVTLSTSPQKVVVTHASSSHKSKKKLSKKKSKHSSDNEDSFQSKPSKNVHHKVDSQAEESSSKERRCCEVQREDSFDHFGRYIATLLRNLPSRRSACKLQKEMISWVLKEQMLFED